MAFTKIAAAGIGSTGTVTLENVVVTGSITASLTGTATSTTNIPNLTGAITSNNTTTSLGSFSSANLSAALTDETGSGANVFAISPVLVTPSLGIATAQSLVVSGITTLGITTATNLTAQSIVVSGITTLGITSATNLTAQSLIVSGISTLGITSATNLTSQSLSVSGISTLGITSSTNLTAQSLSVSGISTFTNGPILVGTATSTGTASQPLQVTGGAYVSGNLGIGTTNPQAPLHVVGSGTTALLVSGNARITGILTVGTSSLTFDGNANTITGLSTITGSSNFSKPNLSGISSSISSTAVDVFVYDTRKDSDGGAWRKRTQHTSWYNETLNTATRGSRKDFPAVAVIVATTTTVTIYDGDDPDMPMWMVFNRVASPPYGFLSYTPAAICMLNGILMFVGYTATRINFIQDFTSIYFNTGYYQWLYPEIINRNASSDASGSTPLISSSISIISTTTNDVAMTVLPNAPIDPSTGLPVPTIAVATAGGTSIIRDDGTVANAGGTITTKISINEKGIVYFASTANGGYYGYSLVGGSLDSFFNTVGNLRILSNVNSNTNNNLVVPNAFNLYSGQTIGLTIVNKDFLNTYNDYNGMVAYATTSYNTGWMHGDIKGAWLSDTSTASVTGTELITNGTFDSNVTGWTTNTSTNTWSSGTMQITRSGGSGSTSYQSFTTVAGQRYVATAQVNSSGSRGDLYIINGTGWAGTVLGGVLGTSGQTLTLTSYFTAISTTTTIGFGVDNNGTSIFVDNVSVRREEPDRSVNNKGLAVYGTITKTAVATGANLVAYSGFSTTIYLQQPYNSALSFGTNDFSVMFWHYHTAGQNDLNILRNTGGADGWGLYIGNTAQEVYIANGNFSSYGVFAGSSPGMSLTSTWQQWVFVRKYNFGWIVYRNGVQVGTMSALATSNFTETVPLQIRGSGATSDRIALLRISASVPSPTQIAKIYNDEKMLFQENSQATLYGASDAVTALAYDDTTKLLSVGTSSGRSDFQGLRRINNTTTAVTTAISASNGLIAEQ